MRKCSSTGMTSVRKRRARRFWSTKELHEKQVQLGHLRDELSCLLDMVRSRQPSVVEGKEIIRLTNRIKRLERKLGLSTKRKESQENCGAQNIPY